MAEDRFRVEADKSEMAMDPYRNPSCTIGETPIFHDSSDTIEGYGKGLRTRSQIMIRNKEKFRNGFPKNFERMPVAALPAYTETSFDEVVEIRDRLLKNWKAGNTRVVGFRREQLTKLYNGIIEEAPLIVEALARDFKGVFEAALEVQLTLHELTDFLEHLEEWLAPVHVPKPVSIMMDSAKVVYESYGVVLGISPWNFPFSLAMVPAIGAIASGNCFVFKPSELSPNVAAILHHLVTKYLDKDCVAVINGDKHLITKVLELKWDFISFTGSGAVGRNVLAAAAKHLTPTLLELGGKSPAFIDDETCDLRIAARRIVWAKFLNAGQICITVDYVICRPCIKERLVELIKEEIVRFYTDNARTNPAWPRIVNESHTARIIAKLPTDASPPEHGRIVYGGKYNIEDRFIEPTVIIDVDPQCAPIMQSEIFGPVLPIVTMENENDAIEYITSKEKPLAFYIFSDDQVLIEKLTSRISSGGICINDTLMHHNLNTLPFGGVGESGMGYCHGRHSIEQFSHKKSVYQANNYRQVEPIMKVRYPGATLEEALPILFPHNLYSSAPTSNFFTKSFNGSLSTARLIFSVVRYLTGGALTSAETQ
ncbi:aldehyde dehydrogenase 3, member A2 [Massospora cicadina]|nr:aldehyde dehydrogenase 3, member A2 [Massospora cicadina]